MKKYFPKVELSKVEALVYLDIEKNRMTHLVFKCRCGRRMPTGRSNEFKKMAQGVSDTWFEKDVGIVRLNT